MNDLSFQDLLPHLKSLTLLFEQKSKILTQGSHFGKRKGFEDETLEYRNYSAGDDLRYLDWRLLARTDKLYIREGYQKSLHRVYLWLDSSLSQRMYYQKFHTALLLTFSLAYLLLRQNDRVHILQSGKNLRHEFNRLELEKVLRLKNIGELILHAQQEESYYQKNTPKNKKDNVSAYDELLLSLPFIPKSAKLVWFTDLYIPYEELETLIKELKQKQIQLTIFHVHSLEELSVFTHKKKFFSRYIDVENGQWVSGNKMLHYKNIWEDAVKRRMELFSSHKIPYLRALVEDGPVKILASLNSL